MRRQDASAVANQGHRRSALTTPMQYRRSFPYNILARVRGRKSLVIRHENIYFTGIVQPVAKQDILENYHFALRVTLAAIIQSNVL